MRKQNVIRKLYSAAAFLLVLILCAVPLKAGPLSEIILFSCKTGRYFQIYAVRPDGHDLRRILHIRRDCRDPHLCSLNNEVVFSMFSEGRWNICRTNLQGTEITQITSGYSNDRRPVWSPDGSKIAFETDRWGISEIATINADGSDLQRITHNAAVNTHPAWSPDGKELAYVSCRAGFQHICVMQIGNGPGRPITKRSGFYVAPSWSPEGDRLVFQGRKYFGRFLAIGGRKNFFQEFKDGTENASYPAWSVSGDKIIFSDSGEDYQRLSLLDPQTGAVEPFPAEIPSQAYDLVWCSRKHDWGLY